MYLPLDRTAGIPLIRQVYEGLRLRILTGEIQPGERIPSTRGLAAELQVSRNVVVEAVEQLKAEGYLVSRPGAGLYAAEGALLEEGREAVSMPEQNRRENRPAGDERLITAESSRQDIIDFRTGVPALERIPAAKLAALYKAACLDQPAERFGYGEPGGVPELTAALAGYLARSRGVYCRPEQILITTGAAQGLFLTASVLLRRGDTAAVEDPTHIHFQEILTFCGGLLLPVPVDECGMRADMIPASENPALILVTPSHQFPLGGVLTVQRRLELIKRVRRTGGYIVEDDYESEFRFEGTAVSSMQGLAPNRVIYIGSFSKILAPSLRMGYLVLPPDLATRFQAVKYLLDNHSPVPEQLVIAELIRQRWLDRHILKMRNEYQRRRLSLIRALTAHFPGQHRLWGSATGLHAVAELPGFSFDETLVERIMDAGVRVYPVERHTISKGNYASHVILGYGNLNEREITEGIRRMKTVLRP